MRRTKSKMAARLALTSIVWFVLGFACWVTDRNFCDYLTRFPYLHSFWHVFVCLGKSLLSDRLSVVVHRSFVTVIVNDTLKMVFVNRSEFVKVKYLTLFLMPNRSSVKT